MADRGESSYLKLRRLPVLSPRQQRFDAPPGPFRRVCCRRFRTRNPAQLASSRLTRAATIASAGVGRCPDHSFFAVGQARGDFHIPRNLRSCWLFTFLSDRTLQRIAGAFSTICFLVPSPVSAFFVI